MRVVTAIRLGVKVVEFVYQKKSMYKHQEEWEIDYGSGGDATWLNLITAEYHEQTDSGVITTTLTKEEAVEKFDSGYGGTRGRPFTAWTKDRVYFPVCYDGSEWVESVPRNFPGSVTEHVGGG